MMLIQTCNLAPSNISMLTTPSGFGQISGASISGGKKPTVSGFNTIFDSGTTTMYGPPSDVEMFYAQIPGSKLFDSSQGYYSFPKYPKVLFNWACRWTSEFYHV